MKYLINNILFFFCIFTDLTHRIALLEVNIQEKKRNTPPPTYKSLNQLDDAIEVVITDQNSTPLLTSSITSITNGNNT